MFKESTSASDLSDETGAPPEPRPSKYAAPQGATPNAHGTQEGAHAPSSAHGAPDGAHGAPNGATYSFRDLCLVHYDEMTRFARRLTCDDEARADDIVQDAMVRAMRAWPRWRPQGDPAGFARAWLYRIVNATFLNNARAKRCLERRQETRWRDLIDAVHPCVETSVAPRSRSSSPSGVAPGGVCRPLDYAGVSAEVPSDTHALGDEVLAAFGALSVDHREVVMLHYVSGLECEEIAVALGVPKNTVFTRLARARAILERLLRNYARKEYRIEKRSARTSGASAVAAAGTSAGAGVGTVAKAATVGAEVVAP